MSRSPAMSGKAMATKSLKEKWLSMVQSVREKGENGVRGSSTVTLRVEVSEYNHTIRRSMENGIVHRKGKHQRYRLSDLDLRLCPREEVITR